MDDPAVTAKQLVDLAKKHIEDQQRRIARQREYAKYRMVLIRGTLVRSRLPTAQLGIARSVYAFGERLVCCLGCSSAAHRACGPPRTTIQCRTGFHVAHCGRPGKAVDSG
jgi:hypothetical protein